MTTLAPHQQRVVDERDELADRLSKLTAFFATPIFAGLDVAERMRLRTQAHHMGGYLAVLGSRVEAFTKPVVPDITDEMVNRFLAWRLPRDFAPDGGVQFTPPRPDQDPAVHWPSGTNLLNALQAKAMLQHVLGG